MESVTASLWDRTIAAVKAAKWKRGEFKPYANPRSPEGVPATIQALLHRGLAIRKEGPGYYVVSHAASGKSIGTLDTLAKAKAFVVRLCLMADWEQPEAALLKLADDHSSAGFYATIRRLSIDPYTDDVPYKEANSL